MKTKPNHRSLHGRSIAGIFLLAVLLAFSSAHRADDAVRREPIRPIPTEHGQDKQKADLGRRLFADPGLSADGMVSCATCHPIAVGGADPLPKSQGIGGAEGAVNAPTVFNAGFNLAQFWDGRAPSLEAQIDGPIHNPVEMGTSWPDVIARLETDPSYRAAFAAIYPDGITAVNIRDAIAVYERTLITPHSAFDRWLRGDPDALDGEAHEGYRLFKSYGCIACHQGMSLGGNMYHRMGSFGDYFAARGGAVTLSDQGRYNVTGDEQEMHFFKVPSLRLAAMTSPYFHDGSVAELDEAIRMMAEYQLGRSISIAHVDAIRAFLVSIVGRHPELPD